MDMDRYIGRLLDDRYEILEVIGSGGMSVVYKARCHRLNRLVAVKILKDENLQDADFRRRFHAESQAVAMLSHPNIVSVYDVSSSDNADYIVMELIDGITLKQYMEKKGVLNWKETLHFAIQIAKALEHAHSRGLVHRDIKPHNVMVLKNGSVKVADFGIARIMSQSNTLTKEALGSVHYISPEQAKGGRVDNRSDLYSLGVVMYEMITGRPPYDGESPVAVAIQHINGGASRPASLNPNIPRGLEQIILKAMARDLRGRYPTAAAMLYDMDEFRKNPEIVFKSEAPKEDATAATRVVTGIPDQIREAPKPPKQPEPPAKPRTERSAAEERVRQRKSRQRDYDREESNRSSIATVAIVACSVVAMIAIVVFLIMIVQGNTPETPSSVEIPRLLTMQYASLPNYPGIEVVQQGTEYNEEYAAGQIIRQQPMPGENYPFGTKVYVIVSLGPAPAPVLMPEVTGKSKEEAKSLLDVLELDIYIKYQEENSSLVPAGSIIRSEPEVGSKLRDGQTITLVVSLGARVVMAEMPDLLKNGGWDKATAEGMLERRGFKNVTWVPVNSLLPEGKVISQSVAAGERIDVTTSIIVEYSNGIPPQGGDGPDIPVDPTDPTIPSPSGPSDNTEPTAPTEPVVVTMRHTFTDLPNREESYTISILLGSEAVVVDMQVEPGQTSVEVELTGSGTQECSIYVNGEFYKTVMVEFKADAEE